MSHLFGKLTNLSLHTSWKAPISKPLFSLGMYVIPLSLHNCKYLSLLLSRLWIMINSASALIHWLQQFIHNFKFSNLFQTITTISVFNWTDLASSHHKSCHLCIRLSISTFDFLNGLDSWQCTMIGLDGTGKSRQTFS